MCTLCRATDPFSPGYVFHDTGAAATRAGGSVSGTAAALPTFTIDQIAAYLTEGYWADGNEAARSFDTRAGGSLSVDLSQLSAAAKAVAWRALDAWTAVTDIAFTAASAGSADIDFTENGDGAYSQSAVSGGRILYSTVNVEAGWSQYGGYYLQTYIHEIGHAMGLGHAGDYNGTATFGTDAHYANDSWQMSAMSYFGQSETPIDDGTELYLDTPMMADIVAIQAVYGTATRSRAGDTVYGDGQNTGDHGMGLNGARARTILDTGGRDLIDLASRGRNQRLDLRDERFSDINGAFGNLGIARGTVIEDARTGAGDDTIIGNYAANRLEGGAGDDTLRGGGGDDRLWGGAGSDTLHGDAGFDRATFHGAESDWQAVWDAAAANEGLLGLRSLAREEIDRVHGIEELIFDESTLGVEALLATLAARFGPVADGAGYSITLSDLRNHAPVAADDAARVVRDGQLVLDLLANDSDPDGDALRVVALDDGGLRGSVELGPDGRVTYDARGAFRELYEGQSAVETFGYTVSDGAGGTATATARITVTGSGSAPAYPAGAAMEIGRTSIGQGGPGYWQHVRFDGAIPDAAVVMGPPSAQGRDPMSVRVRNVTETGFEFQIDEWDYLDGVHAPVEISWMAGTIGRHVLEDGSRIDFGAASADGSRVEMSGFDSTPLVLGQLSGDAIGTALTHRIGGVSATGFAFEVQAEQAQGGTASGAGETLYWAGIEDRGAAMSSGRADIAQRMTATGALAGELAVFADMQTTRGVDTAALRYGLDGKGLLSLKVEEEASADAEILHAEEELGWITAATGRHALAAAESVGQRAEAADTTVLEVSTLTVTQVGGDQWHTVDFSQAISDAAVVMGPVSDAGANPVTVRVRNVTERGFEFQIDEWDYLDGAHAAVELSWMAGSRGAHALADGSRVVLGASAAKEVAGGHVALSGFDEAPLVLAQLTGGAEDRALVHRLSQVGSDGFDFTLQTGEAARSRVSDIDDELLYWIALDPAGPDIFTSGTLSVDSRGAALGPAAGDGALFADMQDMRGADTAALRYGRDGNGTRLWIEEERSADSETAHLGEHVGWLGAQSGVYDLI